MLTHPINTKQFRNDKALSYRYYFGRGPILRCGRVCKRLVLLSFVQSSSQFSLPPSRTAVVVPGITNHDGHTLDGSSFGGAAMLCGKSTRPATKMSVEAPNTEDCLYFCHTHVIHMYERACKPQTCSGRCNSCILGLRALIVLLVVFPAPEKYTRICSTNATVSDRSGMT